MQIFGLHDTYVALTYKNSAFTCYGVTQPVNCVELEVSSSLTAMPVNLWPVWIPPNGPTHHALRLILGVKTQTQPSVCFGQMTCAQSVMSAFIELRLLFCPPSSSLLYLPSLFPNIRFTCCWLPSSPGLDPKLPPSVLIWFKAADFLAGNPLATRSHLMAPRNRMHVCKGAWHLCCAGCECASIWKVSACTCARTYKRICHNRHIYPNTLIHVLSCPPSLCLSCLIDSTRSCKGLWWKTGGWGGLGPREGWRGLRPEQGRVRKRAGGLGPLSFINLNVYTSWSPAMRPFSFPQVSASRIRRPFLHSFSPAEAAKTPLLPLITAGISDKTAVQRLYRKAKKF